MKMVFKITFAVELWNWLSAETVNESGFAERRSDRPDVESCYFDSGLFTFVFQSSVASGSFVDI